MLAFTYQANPARVVFGDGALAGLPEEVARLGAARALVLSTPEQKDDAERLAAMLGARAVGVHDKAVMHVPAEAAAAACARAEELGADLSIAIGGGSTIGLAKAIARGVGLPILAIPTTYAGSEMTPIWGLTESGVKTTGRDVGVMPKTVIYDPELTDSLPKAIAGPSGMNAIAHAVEALYAADANPVTSLMAEESIRALALSLPKIMVGSRDKDARSHALYGAWLAGAVLGQVGMALHHKLCHTLGGSFGLPHADTHTIVLPHAAAYNAAAAPEAMARVARALDVDDAPSGLYDLADSLGAKLALADLGMLEDDLDRAADLATQKPYPNPRAVERDAIRALLDDAFHGRRPSERR